MNFNIEKDGTVIHTNNIGLPLNGVYTDGNCYVDGRSVSRKEWDRRQKLKALND
jgi:hypothetical protein